MVFLIFIIIIIIIVIGSKGKEEAMAMAMLKVPPINSTPSLFSQRPSLKRPDCHYIWSGRKGSKTFMLGYRMRVRAETSTITTSPQEKAPISPSKKDISFQVVNITQDTLSLRGCSLDRLKFEVEYGLKRGTTDNSYVVKGTSGVAIIDVPDESFTDLYLTTLEKTIDLKKVKYIVLGHLSPKRVESLTALCDLISKNGSLVQVYCSNPAAQLLSASYSDYFKSHGVSMKIVRGDDFLDLGGGHKLEFILTPTPRWPDGLCTYDPTTQLLFTHKLFSAHVCTDSHFDIGGWEVFGPDWEFFFECMLSPNPRQANAALERLPIVAQFSKPSYEGKTGLEILKADARYILSTVLRTLNFPLNKASTLVGSLQRQDDLFVTSAICPMHGPIVRFTLTELVRQYQSWTMEKLKQTKEATIAVIYASAYGNTAALAQAISRGILKAGVGVESINAEIISPSELASALQNCSGFVVGSPTLGGHIPTPIQNALGVILKDSSVKTKPCGVFGSFGWSGEAVDMIEQRLKDGGFSFAFPTIRCKFKPSESVLQTCEESGTDLAQAIKRLKLKRSKDTSQILTASNVEQAVGRVIGSLCVLSAKDGDAESAMLASWVSQASFVPPGLTIAVAKDRAVESLVRKGGKFVLNVLGDGKSSAIAKQLLKAFKPGEPRFEGLDTKESKNGGRILSDAISWMECTVMSRMEAGDHWILYASVEDGELQDDKAFPAIHYRKTGARY